MFITTSDDYAAEVFEKAGIPNDILTTTGYPRNDVLHKSIPGEDIGSQPTPFSRMDNSCLIAYLPTSREYNKNPVNEALDLVEFDKLLAGLGANLLISPHPNSEMPQIDGLDHIRIMPPAADIYPVLRDVDILITDYSSVYFDYLLTNGKVIFYPHDMEKYRQKVKKDRFITSYQSITPGPKPTNFEELCKSIKCFVNGANNYENDRSEIRKRLHKWTDGEYSRRVYEEIKEL